MNGGSTSDAYSDVTGSNNGFNGGKYLFNGGSLYEFTTSGSPSFPGTGGGASGTTAEQLRLRVADVLADSQRPRSPSAAPVISPQLSYFNPGSVGFIDRHRFWQFAHHVTSGITAARWPPSRAQLTPSWC